MPVKYIVVLEELAGAEDPEKTKKMIADSLENMLGVKSCIEVPEDSIVHRRKYNEENSSRCRIVADWWKYICRFFQG